MLDALTIVQITAAYNRFAASPVKKFETKKIASARLLKLLGERDISIEQALGEPAAAPKQTFVEFIKEDAPAVEPECPGVVVGQLSKNAVDIMAPRAMPKGQPVKRNVKPAKGAKAKPVKATKAVAKTVAKAPKAAKPEQPAKTMELGLSGTKLALLKMMQRAEGVSEAEGCAVLNWTKCGATILKVAAVAQQNGYEMHRWRGDDKKTRYSLVLAVGASAAA